MRLQYRPISSGSIVNPVSDAVVHSTECGHHLPVEVLVGYLVSLLAYCTVVIIIIILTLHHLPFELTSPCPCLWDVIDPRCNNM